MKIIISLIVLLSFQINAQTKFKFVSVGIDAKNAIIGSKPTNNKSEIDFNLKIGAVYKNLEISIFYENFNKINFQAYGVNVNLYNKTDVENLTVSNGIQLGFIIREGNSSFPLIGFNNELRYKLYKKLIVGLELNTRARYDISLKKEDLVLRSSVFINLYKTF